MNLSELIDMDTLHSFLFIQSLHGITSHFLMQRRWRRTASSSSRYVVRGHQPWLWFSGTLRQPQGPADKVVRPARHAHSTQQRLQLAPRERVEAYVPADPDSPALHRVNELQRSLVQSVTTRAAHTSQPLMWAADTLCPCLCQTPAMLLACSRPLGCQRKLEENRDNPPRRGQACRLPKDLAEAREG